MIVYGGDTGRLKRKIQTISYKQTIEPSGQSSKFRHAPFDRKEVLAFRKCSFVSFAPFTYYMYLHLSISPLSLHVHSLILDRDLPSHYSLRCSSLDSVPGPLSIPGHTCE